MLTMTGTIQRIVDDKGYGWIRTPDGRDWFFHQSELTGDRFENITEGLQVQFTAVPDAPKGPRAIAVSLL